MKSKYDNDEGLLVPFTEKDVKDRLDELIIHWRDIRDNGLEGRPDLSEENELGYSPATCYVDAFQSFRHNLFGELLA